MFESPNLPPIDLNGVNHIWYENIQYGSTNKEIMDIFIPTDAVIPTGVVIYMHAGGFVQWDKSRAYATGQSISTYLSNNIAFATIDYDLIETDKELNGYMTCMDSGKRAIQFLKLFADLLNIDKSKFHISGASAGAGIGMWIAYQPDLAEPGSSNPLLRESTTIKSIDLLRPQSTYNILRWESEVFATVIPAWDLQLDYESVPDLKKSLDRTYATENYQDFLNATSYRNSLDMLQFIDDNGGIETYINSPDVLYTNIVGTSIPDISHSPYHGQIIKQYLDAESTPNVAYLNGLYTDPSGETKLNFILRNIG